MNTTWVLLKHLDFYVVLSKRHPTWQLSTQSARTQKTHANDWSPHRKSKSDWPISRERGTAPNLSCVAHKAQRGVRRWLRLWMLCCVSLSAAGSAVGPCGSAGRTVRRCLSAASNRISFTSDWRQNRQVDPPPASHPRFDPNSWLERVKRQRGQSERGWCRLASLQGRWHYSLRPRAKGRGA